jgi:ABC-2 type transport system permease protein
VAGIATESPADSTLHRRGQLTAIAELRWRMFVNGLRSRRGKMELVSRIIVTSAFALGGIGGFTIATIAAYYFLSEGKGEMLAVLLWPIFFFWQVFPVMSTAFTNNPDSTDLLRFPLTYRSYFLIRLAYGFGDPASALGTLTLCGIFLGVSSARPALIPWALLALPTFALFNLVLQQTVFAWLERWLAQRRTREILGVLFILFLLSFQLIGPIMGRVGNKPQPELRRVAEIITRVQAVLPPGLAAGAIAQAAQKEYLSGLASLLALAMVAAAVGFLLHLRLRAQFRGENLSEAGARPVVVQTQGLQLGWDIPGLSQTVTAVFEKEVRYLARSGPMLLTLVMPVFVLLVFRLGPMSAMHPQSTFVGRTPELAFPAAAAYAMLVLTNLVYNSFGGDAGGIQFFYASPARFRQIVLGKNLLHASILLANTLLAWIAITFFYGAPHPAITFATIAGLLFAAPINFTAGNLLSIYTPRKRDFATFGRQNVSQTTVLASLGVQIVIVAVGVAAFVISRLLKNPWIAPAEFLILAAVSIPLYVMVLGKMDGIALQRRETLIAELCRA